MSIAQVWKLDTSSNEAILKLFDNSPFIVNTLDKDPSTSEEEALIEVFKKQRPGEPPTLDNARNLLRALFFDPKRYDLTKVGRYKLNQRLGVGVPEDVRVLTTEDIVALDGQVLIGRGTIVTALLLDRLGNYARTIDIVEPVQAVPAAQD